jgi:YD repeat-containing protein
LLILLTFSCNKNELEKPVEEDDTPLESIDPGNGTNCLLAKHYTETSGKRSLLDQYEYDNADKLIKITHNEGDGKQSIRRFEYDEKGRLVKIYEKLSSGVPVVEYEGSLNFLYDVYGRVYKVDARRIKDGAEEETQNRLVYYNDFAVPQKLDQVVRITSSFANAWDFEYDAKGNATKTYYTPNGKSKYLLEEYSSYDEQPQDKPLDKIFFLRNFHFAACGSSFSKNHVLAYKVYNPDGSVLMSYDIKRQYSTSGNPNKMITTAIGNGTTTTTTLLSDYRCR